MINYDKLMSTNPFELGKLINNDGQTIHFYEHPTLGDQATIIAVCHSLKLAEYTDFFDLEDMTSDEHNEYYPVFADGKLTYEYELG